MMLFRDSFKSLEKICIYVQNYCDFFIFVIFILLQ